MHQSSLTLRSAFQSAVCTALLLPPPARRRSVQIPFFLSSLPLFCGRAFLELQWHGNSKGYKPICYVYTFPPAPPPPPPFSAVIYRRRWLASSSLICCPCSPPINGGLTCRFFPLGREIANRQKKRFKQSPPPVGMPPSPFCHQVQTWRASRGEKKRKRGGGVGAQLRTIFLPSFILSKRREKEVGQTPNRDETTGLTAPKGEWGGLPRATGTMCVAKRN